MQRDRRKEPHPWSALFPVALLSGLIAGCGAPAAPLPPTLNLPQPVRDLAAHRTGDTVHLTFSVPQKTTDRLPVRGAITAKLCRSADSSSCQLVSTLAIPMQTKSASIDDPLPAELRDGPPRLLAYKVSLLNRAGKTEGESAAAYAVAGTAPMPVTGLSAAPRRKGIVLSWQGTENPAGVVHFDRTRISTSPSHPEQKEGNAFMARKAPEEPAEQVLRVSESPSDRRFSVMDATAHTGCSYRYIAQRIKQVTLANHELEIASLPSAPIETEYRDIFPPLVPGGLVSAADSTSKAIDLNWTPDVDPSLAGYVVYRRPAGSNQVPERISPAGKPVVASSWSDTSALPGQRYAYSVSAIDISGNESQRSAEIEDQWNALPSNSQP